MDTAGRVGEFSEAGTVGRAIGSRAIRRGPKSSAWAAHILRNRLLRAAKAGVCLPRARRLELHCHGSSLTLVNALHFNVLLARFDAMLALLALALRHVGVGLVQLGRGGRDSWARAQPQL